jgi:hypothetical protein
LWNIEVVERAIFEVFSEFQNQKNLWFQVLENVQRTDSSGERTSKG